MASKHRKRSLAANRLASAGVATATASALVVTGSPLPPANNVSTPVALTASTAAAPGLPAMPLAPGAPDPASIPDLSFGLGPRGYEAFQTYGAQLETAFLDNVNLAGVLASFGIDPETDINAALGNALVSALTGVTIPTDQIPVIGGVLENAGITNAEALLDLLGVNLSDPLGLTGPTPGLNIITAGPPFSLLKFAGIDLGWVPGFPNSVASEINGTQYLGISPTGLLQTLKDLPGVTTADKLLLDPIIVTVDGIFGDASALDVRVPVVLGFGLGAFAAGMAYPQVVADLPNQPGGANATNSPLLGSITILPMILLRNPGRANGGLFARFYPQAGLLGIDTVTPDTEVTNSNTGTGLFNIPVGNTGIVLGGANLIPIKVDATVEYDPLSDVPAWPNPVSIANSLAALAFPTYILRGVDEASVTQVLDGQLKPQIAAALANGNGPLALNLYLTLPVNNALPLLEPVRLPIDVVNLFTGANLNNPLATALEPVLTTLTNLGYTDVKRTVVNGVPVYDRTLDQGNVITPFGTLPTGVDWGQVPGDLFVQLLAGVGQALSQGLVGSTPVVNPLGIIAGLLGVNLPGATGTSPLTDLVSTGNIAVTSAADSAVPTGVQSRVAVPETQNALAAGGSDDSTPAPDTIEEAANETATTDTDAEPDTKPDKPVKVTTTSPAAVKQAADGLDSLNKAAQQGQASINNAFKRVADGVNGMVRAATGQDQVTGKTPEAGDKDKAPSGGAGAGDDSSGD